VPLRYDPEWFTPARCRAEPGALWVFGDNAARAGRGPKAGQAYIRDEPNAVGIVTKRMPNNDPQAFLNDAEDFEDFLAMVAPAFERLARHLQAGGIVVWPRDGIGTGRAQLAARAPRIWAALERARVRLEGIG
jgi:hypothetical protein